MSCANGAKRKAKSMVEYVERQGRGWFFSLSMSMCYALYRLRKGQGFCFLYSLVVTSYERTSGITRRGDAHAVTAQNKSAEHHL